MSAGVLLTALLIGLTVGLFGSGGSILTVPVLVLLLDMSEKQAIQLALGIVACISFVGVLPHLLKKRVSHFWLIRLAVPGMLGAVVGGAVSPGFSAAFQIGLLASLMLLSSWNMWRREPWHWHFDSSIPVLVVGLLLGILTGLIGVGGGFLLIPLLLAVSRLHNQEIVATSLMLVFLQSSSGFISQSIALQQLPDGVILSTFAAIGALGTLLALFVLPKIPQLLFRRSFALLLPVLAGMLVWQHWF